jgi:signal transduction histidine kinase
MGVFASFFLLFLATLPARATLEVPKSYFEDKTASLTIKDIMALPPSASWHPVTTPKPQFGSTHSRVWLRFSLQEAPGARLNPSDVLLLEIPNAYLKRLDLYGVVDGKVVRHSATGTAVPLSGRDDGVLRAATFTFRILPPHDPRTEYFLSAESNFPLSVPFRLWMAKDYTVHQWIESLFLGAFFGGLAIAAGFNGFLAFSLRSRLYLNYSLFVASVSMLFLAHEGLSVQFLWPESSWWAMREPFFFGGIAVIFYARFVREFLESRRIAPRMDFLLRLLIWAVFLSDSIAVVTIRQPFTSLSQVFVVILNLLALGVAAKALQLRTRAAGYFLLSSLGFNVSMILFQLQESNLIWIGSFVDKAPHVSLALEVLLLSFALADRIRQVNLELAHQKAAVIHSEKMSALGRLAGEISHEINNPLTIILGNATLIGKTDASPLVKEFAATIEHTANRISKIVKGMRSLSRDSRNDPLHRTSLSALLQDAMSLFGERAQQGNVQLEIGKLETDTFVLCRGSEICQVLLNLLNNAFDAVEGMPSAWVKLEAEELPGRAEISVSDNGPGVPEALRPRILDPFFTTKEPGKGLGLGLSISRSIVEAHGGKIWLDEKSSQTRFVFTLPLAGKVS